MFLWLYQRRRLLCASGGACGFSQTVHEALNHHGKLPRELRRTAAPTSGSSTDMITRKRSLRVDEPPALEVEALVALTHYQGRGRYLQISARLKACPPTGVVGEGWSLLAAMSL